MKNNKDFLRQFFKEQNIFQTNEDFSEPENTQDTHNTSENIDTTQFTTHKNINLKAIFQTIEEEKQKIKNITKNTNTLKTTKEIDEEIREREKKQKR